MLLTIVTLVLALQDPAKLPAIVDSWYEVTADGEYAGWYHETISKSGMGHGYFSEGEYDRSDTTNIEKCVAELSSGFEVTSSEGASILVPAMYLMRHRGDLAKAADIKLNGVTYQVKAAVDRTVLGKKIRVAPVVVEKGTPLSKYWVDGYGRIIEAESADGKFTVKLSKDSTAAKGGLMQLRGRRDPFGKPLTPKDPEPGPVETKRPLPQIPDTFNGALAAAEALLDDLRRQMAACGLNADQTYQDILYYIEKLYPEARMAGRMPGVLRVKLVAERLYGGAEKLVREAMASLDRTREFAHALQVEAIAKEIARIRAFQGRREFFQAPEETLQLKAILERAVEFRDQCRVRIELARMSIELQGIATQREDVRETVGLHVNICSTSFHLEEPILMGRNSSCAILNGEAYHEGEVIPGLGVRVDRISRQGVEVSYRGEVREIGLRK